MTAVSPLLRLLSILRLHVIEKAQLTRCLTWLGSRGDVAAALLVALVVAMMMLPVPVVVIDALIGVNIGAAVLLVALALYLPSAVSFSSFPIVLLLTTLFRLGIEVGASRSILLHADAGEIVDTFGRYVAGDNLAVGVIVFSIVAIVQFLVVTKGAERVAEVAARFTLDAIPGRQMAIDADLRAGFVRPETAQQLRLELARESRMHGAMDGAMRFVKGDAIAGLVIVGINLTAGIALGVVQHGLSFEQAVARYSILTIGNALIAQIPALLIAIAAALLITRSGESGGAGATVGRQIADQLGGAPAAWFVAAGVMAMFAAAPGMPWPVFLLLGGAMLAAALLRQRRDARAQARSEALALAAAPVPGVVPDDADVRQIVPMRPLVVSLAQRETDPDAERVAALTRAARRVRNELVLRYGVTVPVIEIDALAPVAECDYEIAIHEVALAAGRLHWDRVCVPVTDEMEALAREHGVSQSFPLIDGAVWLEPFRLPESAAGDGLRLGPTEYFARLLRRLLHRHAAQFVGIHEAQLVFNWLQREMPATAKELSQALTLPRFAEVMKLLVVERVSLRNVREIAETLVIWAPREKETLALAEHVRVALGLQICQEFAQGAVLHALLLARALEEMLGAALQETPRGAMLIVDHDTTLALVERIRALNCACVDRRMGPVLLTTQALRRPLRQLLAEDLFDTHVLSYAEVGPMQRVQVLATVCLDEQTPAAE